MSANIPAPPKQTARSGRTYTVEPPVSYGVLDPFGIGPKFELKVEDLRFIRRPEKPLKPKAPEGPEKRAIWIVHGMGQQIPFETLDSLAEGIMRVGEPAGGGNWAPKFRAVKVGDQTLQRVELNVKGDSGNEYELHLYEAYWAPKTEGVAKITDVVGFLWDGGTRGMLNSMKSFKRAIFGGVFDFQGGVRTPFYITLTMLVLTGLTLLNAVIVAASAAKVGTLAGAAVKLPSLTDHFAQISAMASMISAVAITFGCVLFLAQMSKPERLHGWYRSVLQFFSWMGTTITAIAVVIGGALLGGVVLPGDTAVPGASQWKILFVHGLYRLGDNSHLQEMATFLIISSIGLVVVALIIRGVLRSETVNPAARIGVWILLFLFLAVTFAFHLAAILYPILLTLRVDCSWLTLGWIPSGIAVWFQNPFWVWPFLIFLSTQIKTLLVEYVGDVAIYVNSNKIDRFDDVRAKIKDIALKSASAVYLAKQDDSDEMEYQHIAIVGHSLGSVIAYDTLNRLMNDDRLSGNKIKVADRTDIFETFGSPLDKTTFFFTIQGKDSFQIREQLAAVVQPINQNCPSSLAEYHKFPDRYPTFRKFPWINVFSRNDIISGHLDYFDPPKNAGLTPDQKAVCAEFAVKNFPDHDAAVALVAHVDYWRNTRIWNLLYEHIAP